MTITFLHELFCDAFGKIAVLMAAHDSCKPTEEQLQSGEVDVQVEVDRPTGTPQVS